MSKKQHDDHITPYKLPFTVDNTTNIDAEVIDLLHSREKQYGSFATSAETVMQLRTWIRKQKDMVKYIRAWDDHQLNTATLDLALTQVCVKISRASTSRCKLDHYLDILGYIELMRQPHKERCLTHQDFNLPKVLYDIKNNCTNIIRLLCQCTHGGSLGTYKPNPLHGIKDYPMAHVLRFETDETDETEED